jgi:fluoride exporter
MVYLLVGAAGVVGALLRFYLGVYVHDWWHYSFPLGTLLTNLIGSFVLGWGTMYLFKLDKLHPNLVTSIGTGLIGSFTTFSTFSVETVELINHSQWAIAFIYVTLSVLGGLLMSWVGYSLGKMQFYRYQLTSNDPEGNEQ